MIKKIALGILLLLCVFGAGCIIEVTDPGIINPTQTPAPSEQTRFAEIVGDWEGYDAAKRTTYDLQCSVSGYAELETDDESTFPDIEKTLRGTWEGSGNTYTLKLSDGTYAFTITENPRTAELTTPNGTKVTMYRDY